MERLTKRRLVVTFLLFGMVLGLFGFRLYDVQVLDPDAGSSGASTYTTWSRVAAARGDITDRNGVPLVSNRASYNLVMNNYVFYNSESPNESLRQLVNLLWERDIEYIEHFPVTASKPYEYTLDEYGTLWQGYFHDFLTYRDLDPDISAAQLMKQLRSIFNIPDDWQEWEVRCVLGLHYELELRTELTSLSAYTLVKDVASDDLTAILELGISGLNVETSTTREYLTPYAAHILGYMGLMSPEEYEVYKEQGYSMDAYVGKSGVELAFEEYLHGTDGSKYTKVDAKGNIISEYYSREPKAGSNVELTIDIEMQAAGEKALEATILELRKNGLDGTTEGMDAEGGAVVALDIKTGEVLVCASYPSYDLSTFRQNYNDLVQQEFGPLNNRALGLPQAPGSAYKMVVTIAGINNGNISSKTYIEDKGVYTKYEDYQPACLIWTNRRTTHKTINVMEALMVSCNYYFYETGDQVGMAPIDAVAKELGLGEPTGVELQENIGRRSNKETKEKLYANDPSRSGWYEADTLQLSIGQGENRFTPMQLAVYTAALANRGTRYKATFLSRVVSSNYDELLLESSPQILSQCPVAEDAYYAYTTGMYMAANRSKGTAYALLHDYPIKCAAKTGTAQHGAGGSDNASFVCYAPYDDPQIAIAIYVEKGAQGGNLAKIATAIMDVYFAQTEQANTDMGKENIGY